MVKVKKTKKSNSTLTLDPWRIKPFADQPRKRFRGIKQLAGSIRLVGQVTPIIVTPIEENGFDAELIDGERRLQACRTGKMQVTAIVQGEVSAADRFALSIAANFCRQEHDCIEIAESVRRLKSQGKSGEQIAGIFGKTHSWVSQHNSLLSLHPDVQTMLKRAGDEQRESKARRRARGRMTMSVALLLVPLDQATQLKAAKWIATKKLSMAAARNYVWKLGIKRGRPVGKRTSPRQKFNTFWSVTDTYRHSVERYAVLSYSAWQQIVATAKARETRALAGQLRSLCDDLSGIADSLEKAGEK